MMGRQLNDQQVNGDDDAYASSVASASTTATDPGQALMIWTVMSVVLLIGCVLPLSLYLTRLYKERRKKSATDGEDEPSVHLAYNAIELTSSSSSSSSSDFWRTGGGGLNKIKEDVHKDNDVVAKDDESVSSDDSTKDAVVLNDSDTTTVYLLKVIRMDRESWRLVSYAVPFTVTAVAGAVLDSICLALVGYHTGTKQLTAYAELTLLIGLTDEFLQGPLHALPTVCANAIGANNTVLAGQYVQLSTILYLLIGLPFFLFWYNYTDTVIYEWLGWGDNLVAYYAQNFFRIYVWSFVVKAFGAGIGHLLNITDHEIFVTVVEISEGCLKVGALLALIFATNMELTLELVGYIYIAASIVRVLLLLIVGHCAGWLRPFTKGLYQSFSLSNLQAVSNMLNICLPLSIGSVLSNAEWAILGVFAAHMGVDEVAAWSLVGYVWYLFDSLTYGAGDAAEIQVALHLGEGHHRRAKLAAHKAIFLAMTEAVVFFGIFLSLQHGTPKLFTPDATLQALISETIPYMGVGYLALTFGYLCWYIVGATGRYDYATWVHWLCSWGVTLPLAALWIFHNGWDLKALTASVVIGYAFVGCVLAYTVFTTDWEQVAQQVQEMNQEEEDEYDGIVSDEGKEDDANAPLPIPTRRVRTARTLGRHGRSHLSFAATRSRVAKSLASQNIVLFMVPVGKVLGLQIASPSRTAKGTIVTFVSESSFLHGRVLPGDRILSIDGFDVGNAPAPMISAVLEEDSGGVPEQRRWRRGHREIAVLTKRKRFRRIKRKLLACDTITACGDVQMEDLHEIETPIRVKYKMMV